VHFNGTSIFRCHIEVHDAGISEVPNPLRKFFKADLPGGV
jgi:hypothetical protein